MSLQLKQALDSIGDAVDRHRDKRIDKSKFLTRLKDLNITKSINDCTQDTLRNTTVELYKLLFELQKDLVLPNKILSRTTKVAECITAMLQSTNDETTASIALYKTVVSLLEVDLLLLQK